MRKVILPSYYNYVGAFLTFSCQLKCSYCINNYRHPTLRYKQLNGEDWIKGLNRLQLKEDLPLTLQGGEPTLHPDFYEIVNGIHKEKHIDLLTNGMFNVEAFVRYIKPNRLKRNSPYASIRVSFHVETMELTSTMEKVLYLKERGYHVGVWIVDHPRDSQIANVSRNILAEAGVDCRMKEFLGYSDNKLFGTYLYPRAVDGQPKYCLCKPSELLIAPDGSLHRCHYELYNNIRGYAHLLDEHIRLPADFYPCEAMGLCNPCDIKLKNDRFQRFGHCSVEIKQKNE